jgi:hypothetical protein
VTSQITRNSLNRSKSHMRKNCIKVAYLKAQFEEIKQNAPKFQRLITGKGLSEGVIRRITFNVMCDVI